MRSRQLRYLHGANIACMFHPRLICSGLLIMFVMRTAIELHRAWHMTLLTSKILQQVKDVSG